MLHQEKSGNTGWRVSSILKSLRGNAAQRMNVFRERSASFLDYRTFPKVLKKQTAIVLMKKANCNLRKLPTYIIVISNLQSSQIHLFKVALLSPLQTIIHHYSQSARASRG
jgi:hypothetical protein